MKVKGELKVIMANYKKYVELYKKKAKRLQYYGYSMADKMKNKTDFEQFYKALYNQKKIEIAEKGYTGKQKEVGNLYKEIVEEQSSGVSFKQARAARAANPELNKSLRWFQYGEEFWKNVDTFYKEQRDEGLSANEVMRAIAVTFFGSP